MALIGCHQKKSGDLFNMLSASYTGIDFQNTIIENDSINILDFQYCYNGGGVGIGDFNNDGLEDLFFTGNQVSSRCYLNKGNLKFEDITAEAGLTTETWITGVSIVDINTDGLDDIYLNVGGANCTGDCPNLLFVNQGMDETMEVPRFKEMAQSYGLDEKGYAQQTVFFDFDQDGDLDAFIARNGNVPFDKNSPVPKNYYPEHLTDILLENTQPKNLKHPYFVDVSEKMGIDRKGFALGLGIADFNDDNLPDVYVGNDFISQDALYINKTNDSSIGFVEQGKRYFKHHTYNAMGLDITDVNNDGYTDVFVLDMLPFTNERRKMMLGIMNYDKYQLALNNGYAPQFMRNTLHINSGIGNFGPLGFKEVAFISGVAATDWSWAPLFADFDSDGDKDLFVTNGYGKDVTDLDFINYNSQNNIFGTPEARETKLKTLLKGLPNVLMPNFMYENVGDGVFEDVSSSWAKQPISLSNGVAYADFDNDGDLDLVTNNIDQMAFVLENTSQSKSGFKYLKINLEGPKKNRRAIGATVKIWSKSNEQAHYQSVIRGYLSSISPIVYFGLREIAVDSLKVTWPDGKLSVLKNIKSNQTLDISWKEAEGTTSKAVRVQEPTLVAVQHKLPFLHQENYSNDYVFQHLLPTQHSKRGPFLAASDNGDLMFIGGSTGIAGQLLRLNTDGDFEVVQEMDSDYEDSFALFVDHDNDGDEDLYVASGSSEHTKYHHLYRDRLYQNSNGFFELLEDNLPNVRESTSCVVPKDYDNDGDIDLFVGSNILPKEYPLAPKNYLLRNDNGVYAIAQEFADLGMVNDAVWADVDEDGKEDLIVVGDWMEVAFLKNLSGRFEQNDKLEFLDAEGNGIETSGWWKSIAPVDFDNDGDKDFLLGNMGTNNFINPSQEYPIYVYKDDFDKNGSIDPVIGAYQKTKKGLQLMPLHSRDDVMKQLVLLQNKYLTYNEFSEVGYKELLEISNLEDSTKKVSYSKSILLVNNGNSTFTLQPLPYSCQLAPINAILVNDVDGDGILDALLTGNDFQGETHFGRYDAFNGAYLKGTGAGFEAVPTKRSGFYVPGQSNSIIVLEGQEKGTLFLAAQNNDSLKVFARF